MAKMRAVDAIVLILEKEGATEAFGLPGAAINPLYSAMKQHGGIRHTLHRHVEGASHAADGYSRATGKIGLCLGTSGPAGTDMITGLYAAIADSIPMLCITGQAPTHVLHKEDFQAVDIESIAKPVTKYASTILEPGLVPGTFAKAFQVMRSSRPGPVLLDLPINVQLAEIDFDIDAYEPLPVEKPKATRGQAEKIVDLLTSGKKPIIIAGGGVINANASGSASRPTPSTATPPSWNPMWCWAWATAGPTATPGRWTPTARDASSSTWTSSPPRSGGCSPRTWASLPTLARRSR